MAGLQLVRLTKEVAYNTFPTSPAGGTQQDIFLPVGNAMTVRAMPQFSEIRDAGQANRKIRKNIGRTAVSGSIQSLLFPTQAAYVLDLAAGITGVAPCLDLPSFSIDNLQVLPVCASVYRRYTGCKVGQFTITADQSEGGMYASWKADIMGSTPRTITSTDFPTPALSAFPADDPFEFFHIAGHVTIGGARTDIQSLQFTINNMTKSFPNEARYVSNVGWFGRDVGLSMKLLYKSNSDRQHYEQGDKQAVSIAFDTGVSTLTLNMQAVNNIDSVEDDLPLDDFFTQTLSLSALVDPASTAGPGGSATDFSFAVTAD
jgi:hypothetical protein